MPRFDAGGQDRCGCSMGFVHFCGWGNPHHGGIMLPILLENVFDWKRGIEPENCFL